MAVTTAATSSVAAQKPYTTGTVTSKDGTIIGYRKFGHGPGLVLVQGTMGTAHNFYELAVALADTFTVYTPDRRGRGMSKSGGTEYNTGKEVEDLDALLAKTDAHYVFGLSAGALISLQAALLLPSIHKVAAFDPVLFVNGLPTDLLARFDREMAQGKVAAAMITAMKAAHMGPPIFNFFPRWLLERMTSMMLAQDSKKDSGDYAPMSELANTLRYDFQIVTEMNGKVDSFKGINTEVLLLGGSKSPTFLKVALDAVAKMLPHAKRIEFSGLDHAAPWNADRGGNPAPVAEELKRFFR